MDKPEQKPQQPKPRQIAPAPWQFYHRLSAGRCIMCQRTGVSDKERCDQAFRYIRA